MSEYKCSHCGFPISPNDPGIRHYGTHVAHEEHRCNYLLLGRIADLERQLAEAESYPGIAHDFETVRLELEEARTEIANRAHTEEQYRLRIEDLERQLAAMSPMIEACKARTERHNPVVSTGRIEQCLCLTCQWYRDYEARKPK